MPIELHLMERGLGRVKTIEITNKALDAAVGIVLEEVPVEAASFAPFVALGEFLAHKEEFFARMGILLGLEQPELGQLLPPVAGHFVKARIFSMHNFVVRER